MPWRYTDVLAASFARYTDARYAVGCGLVCTELMAAIQDNSRPSPDALLAETRADTRGRLKVFLGAAPGVGKTYEMLSAARRRQGEGVDVAVGIVETHGRSETQRLLEGLPVVTPKKMEYRGRTFEELDLDALLACKPKLALVDELAHSNIPGSRHAKRYQDIEELRDAGIDVYTTLNVQHLESYNDLVEKITGVEVRETVPDAVLEAANEIELIDLSPDDLIERLRQGKVYIPEQAQRALGNFFSRGNLLALRELALRAAAERVDDDLSTFMRARGIEGPWPTRGRLIVCVDTSEGSEQLIRTAKQLADQRHVPWTALFVSRLGGSLTGQAREQLEVTLALAERLGGDTATVTGYRIGTEVVAYATQHNAAQIVIGRPQGPSWKRLFRRSLADWLVEHAHRFEVTVAGIAEEKHGEHARSHERTSWNSWLPTPRGLAVSAALIAAAAALSWLLDTTVVSHNLALIFLVAVALAGGLFGIACALFSSVLSFFVYNFLFTEPRYTLLVAEPEDAVTLISFLIVAVVVGPLAARLKLQADQARRDTERVETLFDYSRRLATAVDERDLLSAAGRGIGEIMNADAIVLGSHPDGTLWSPTGRALTEMASTDTAAATWALEHREPAGEGTDTLPAANYYFVPVSMGDQSLGVIGITVGGRRTLGADERRLLFALQTQMAAAWERFRLQRVAADARVNKTTEGLRSALLASVSHDLRTPLVSIIGSLTALRDLSAALSPEACRELSTTALDEAERLNRLVQNLLDMTRLSYGALQPRLAAVDVGATVREAIRRLGTVLQGRSLEVRIAADLPDVRADATLLEQVFVNLLENAAKYSPTDSTFVVDARAEGDVVIARVIDRGPGIAPEDRHRVFDLFYRAQQRDTGVAGQGLGLPICKGFIEAMGGKLAAQPNADGPGTTMEVRLPVEAD